MEQGILTETDGYKVILGTTGPKGDQGIQGIQGLKGDNGETGPQGLSYVNDGNLDLNVRSFKSDGGKVVTDGKGNLSIQGKIAATGAAQLPAIELDSGNGQAYVDFHAPSPNKNNDYDVRIICTGATSNATTAPGTETLEIIGQTINLNTNILDLKEFRITGVFIQPNRTCSTLPTTNVATGTQFFCPDAYSTQNPNKTKGILTIWNGTKWVGPQGFDIATS